MENHFKKFEDENISLLVNKKESLSNQLKFINEQLNNSSNINEFLRRRQYEILINPLSSSKDRVQKDKKMDSIKCKNSSLVKFTIKFIGIFFVILYLIGVFLNNRNYESCTR